MSSELESDGAMVANLKLLELLEPKVLSFLQELAGRGVQVTVQLEGVCGWRGGFVTFPVVWQAARAQASETPC
jgi:hypothetical protein